MGEAEAEVGENDAERLSPEEELLMFDVPEAVATDCRI